MRALILDNYDSFTYNLFQYVAELRGRPIVKKNDEISVREIERLRPTHLIISPGPGTPANSKDFGVCGEAILKLMNRLPILGVCLGHQGIIHVLGGRVVRAPAPMHGKVSEVRILKLRPDFQKSTRPEGRLAMAEDEKLKVGPANIKAGGKVAPQSPIFPSLFRGLPSRIKVMRYHSLVGDPKTLPKELVVTATAPEGRLIMAIQHRTLPLWGIQFHPESIGTPLGKKMLRNFLC